MEALSLAACTAVVNEFEKHQVCEQLWMMGNLIKENFNKFVKENKIDAECIGFPPRMKLIIRDNSGQDSLLYKSLFLQELIEKRIFMHPNAIIVSFSHTKEDISYTINAINESLLVLKKAITNNNVKQELKGNIAQQVIKFV